MSLLWKLASLKTGTIIRRLKFVVESLTALRNRLEPTRLPLFIGLCNYSYFVYDSRTANRFRLFDVRQTTIVPAGATIAQPTKRTERDLVALSPTGPSRIPTFRRELYETRRRVNDRCFRCSNRRRPPNSFKADRPSLGRSNRFSIRTQYLLNPQLTWSTHQRRAVLRAGSYNFI